MASDSVVASNKALAWSMTNYHSQKELKERELLSSLFLKLWNQPQQYWTFQSSPWKCIVGVHKPANSEQIVSNNVVNLCVTHCILLITMACLEDSFCFPKCTPMPQYCLFFRVLWQFWKQLFVFGCVKEPTYSPTAQVPHRKHPLRQLKTRAVLCGWLVPCYTWGWQSCAVGSVANCSRRAPFLILSRKIYRKDQA